jgi:hypothetical protein
MFSNFLARSRRHAPRDPNARTRRRRDPQPRMRWY